MFIISLIRVYFACRRMKLRDKGMTESYSENERTLVSICAFCKTRARIGIDDLDHKIVMYCWKCEKILRTDIQAAKSPPIPAKKDTSGDHNRKVISLFEKTD